MLNIFITGTNNGVGKTFITAGLAATMQSLGYQTCVYKPVDVGAFQKNGFAQSADSVFVKTVDPYIKIFSSYLLKGTTIPALSAEVEKVFIDRTAIKKDFSILSRESDCVITEGTGGIMTPLGANLIVSDLIKDLDLSAVVVLKPDSGINQTLLTINHAQEKGINVRGAIINNYSLTDTAELKNLPRLIEEYSGVKILGLVKNFADAKKINPNLLITEILNGIDIESVFGVKIAKLEIE